MMFFKWVPVIALNSRLVADYLFDGNRVHPVRGIVSAKFRRRDAIQPHAPKAWVKNPVWLTPPLIRAVPLIK
jgi:hypothetical protein